MAGMGEGWVDSSLDTEEGGNEHLSLCFRRCQSESSESTQLSTEASSPDRSLYKSLNPSEGVQAKDWLLELKRVEQALEEEIEPFSLKESKCRRRECTLVLPGNSPLMQRRTLRSLPLNLN